MSSTRAAYLKGADRTAAIAEARRLYELGCTIRSVARQIGRRAIGIEAREEYCEAAARRLSATALPLA